ncbi:hypothetical protein RHSIM_RhsimUnG0189700 [Rhododendron simsii]|uniref:Protein kinase domain-containing protein n=1 Tax=Rhododendron simsii TaxID=118357 RepID=A0A834L3P3_RHOSS|nr:hypothetical protein RHSIM_RhsimUnG0189700 [Rhododendron simsii]
MRLESDGHLKIYNGGFPASPFVDMVTYGYDLGKSQHPRWCGKYGVCRQGECSCPIGIDGVPCFNPTEFQLPARVRSSPDQHDLIEVRNITCFNVIDPGAASKVNLAIRARFQGLRRRLSSADRRMLGHSSERDLRGMNRLLRFIGQCKQAYLQNCSCEAAIFRYNNNVSDGYCNIPVEFLSFREGPIPNYNLIKVQRNQRKLVAIIAGSSFGAFVVLCAVIVSLLVMMRRNNRDTGEDDMNLIPGMPTRFSYEHLQIATDDFRLKLGSGGFWTVFKGKLGDGTEVAMKRLGQRGQGMKEFLAEVSIGSLHHFNLVRLIGYCAEKAGRFLVYEYMSNGSLDNWIYRASKKPGLGWQTQKKIILDIAKGLAYLHEDCRQRKDRKNFERTQSGSSSHLLKVLQEKAEEDRLIDIVENMDEDMQHHREEMVGLAWCLQDDHRRQPSMSTLIKALEGVTEVEPNITYRFTHALTSSLVVIDNVSAAPQASVLSNPR